MTNVCCKALPRSLNDQTESLTEPVGKTLAYTSIKFLNKDNEIVARGSHTKFVAVAQKDPQNTVGELQPGKPETSGPSEHTRGMGPA